VEAEGVALDLKNPLLITLSINFSHSFSGSSPSPTTRAHSLASPLRPSKDIFVGANVAFPFLAEMALEEGVGQFF
jgi:hypothetical protein